MFELSKAVAVVQQDLTRACYHEAAHCAVAFHFGVHGHWRVWAITDQPSVYFRENIAFAGRFYFFTGTTNDTARMMIGLAGYVAECLLEDSEIEAWEIIDEHLSVDEMSDTDAALAGDFTEHHIQESLNIIKSLWPIIKQDAEWGIEAMRDDVIALADFLVNGEGGEPCLT